MSDGSFSLSTTADVLLVLDVAGALAESEKPMCWNYGNVFFGRAKEAEAGGDAEAARAWALLAQLCRVSLQESNASEPFRPMFETSDGRSLMPGDLDQVTADAVRRLGLAAEDPELRARLLDITWERLRDAEAAREAVRSYIDAANRLFHPRHWIDYVDRAERGLRLAQVLEDQALSEAVLADIEQKVIDLDGSDPSFMTARLMELLHEFRKGDPEQMSEIARKAATSAEGQNDFERMRSHLENLRRWRRRADDDEGEREAKIAIAHSYEQQAGLHSAGGGELLAAVWLEKAHESYRNIPGMRGKADEVYERLRTAQQAACGTMQEIQSDAIDISELVKAARDHVAGKPFREALLALATVIPTRDFDREQASVRELMERYPLQGMMGGVKIDRDGRVVAHRTVAFGADEAEAEQALWERVVEHVTMSYQLIVHAQIVPALNQFTFEHSPSLRDLRDLVVNNPFVPQGHEELFAQGFLAGFRWNFAEALSVLVPQLENSLRHLLAQAGAEVTRRDKHGLQSVIQMGTILSDRREQLEPILGADIVKELKVLFSDQHGPDIRNGIAHGLFTHNHFFTYPAIYAWWFIFVLCINPVYRRFQQEPDEGSEAVASHTSGLADENANEQNGHE
jgi:Domain of unknown function (DUF4209)